MNKKISCLLLLALLYLTAACGTGTNGGASAGEPDDPDGPNGDSPATYAYLVPTPAPPENPKFGQTYINSVSGYLCVYLCDTVDGISNCKWVSTDRPYASFEAGCLAANPASEATLEISSASTLPDIADVKSLTTPDTHYIDLTVNDLYYDPTAHSVKMELYLSKLSDNPNQTSGPWTTTNPRKKLQPEQTSAEGQSITWRIKLLYVSLPDCDMLTVDDYLPLRCNSKVSYYPYADYILESDGVYGFVVKTTDENHNVTTAWLPNKVTYTK